MTRQESRIPNEAVEFMAQALRLAERGLGRTDPNPMVGALVVRDGEVVGQGYHQGPGQPHAEIEALRDAGNRAYGADLFVTLEPCNHYGRTPPCTQSIMGNGIARVWYGMADPNPDVCGGGLTALREAGIEVRGPVLEDQCRKLNEVYLAHVVNRRPFVFLKLAMSLDGKIATRTGHSKWITSEESRHQVHELRDRVSAVMVGIGTVLTDDPSLTTRLPDRQGRNPVRIVVDSQLRTPPDATVLHQPESAAVIVACTRSPAEASRRELVNKGVQVLPTKGRDRVDLTDLMGQLYGLGITSLLVEGGAHLAWSVLQSALVDRCLFFYAPVIIGGADAPSGVGGHGVERLDEAPRLAAVECEYVGPDLMVTGRTVYPSG